MGVNDKYVVIGNEAVFPKVPNAKNTKLIGMDFVRLGLERGNTAAAAGDPAEKFPSREPRSTCHGPFSFRCFTTRTLPASIVRLRGR